VEINLDSNFYLEERFDVDANIGKVKLRRYYWTNQMSFESFTALDILYTSKICDTSQLISNTLELVKCRHPKKSNTMYHFSLLNDTTNRTEVIFY
jgi:hypothetical protein